MPSKPSVHAGGIPRHCFVAVVSPGYAGSLQLSCRLSA